MIEKSEKEKQIRPVCKGCRGKPCEGLYWKNFLVFPDIFAVPFDCPLRVEDESKIRWELQSLSDYDVSRIAGDVWVKHNFGARYGNGKPGRNRTYPEPFSPEQMHHDSQIC